MEVTMISRGVEIAIAGGVAETEDALTTVTFFYFYFYFFIFKSSAFVLLRYKDSMHL